jgi:hypothetical protein
VIPSVFAVVGDPDQVSACRQSTGEILGGEYCHPFEPIEVALTGYCEVLEYSLVSAIPQSNTRLNHVKDRGAFVL